MPRRLWVEWSLIALAAIAIASALTLSGVTARLDNILYDTLIRLRAPPPSDQIFIVAIDDESLAAIGRWPWRRSVHAQAIERLADAGAALVAYDVLFTEPSSDVREDKALAAALHRLPVALPVLIEAPGTNGRAFDVVTPIGPLRAKAAALGHVALPHDQDGAARGALLEVRDSRGRSWLHLAEQAYRLRFGTASPAYHEAKVDPDAVRRVPYAPSGAFRTASFKDVLAGSVPARFLRGRLVLVGVTAGGLGDRHPIAGAGTLSGVEAQASLLNTMLNDGFVEEARVPTQLGFAILPTALLLLLFWLVRPTTALVASIALVVIVLASSAGLLIWAGPWLPPAAALIGLMLVYPLWAWRRLSAIDRTIAAELGRFATEPGEDSAALAADPTGRDAAKLSDSIAALRDLKQLISDTIEGVSDPLLVTDLSGHVLLANGQARALLPTEQMEQFALSAQQGEVRLGERVFLQRRTPLTADNRTQRGWITLLADITSIRAAERDREEALEFLSHDMRAPQAAIVTLLQGEEARSVPAALAQNVAAHARRTLRLADDFVQLARMRSTRFSPEETDLRDALAEAMDAVWPFATAKRIRVAASGLDGPRWMLGEAHALTRALFNLLDNAVKFSPENSQVSCRIAELEDRGARWIDIAIRDTGPGVMPARLSRLFDRFGPTANTQSISAGLGLTYVRAVAERHRGTLSYERNEPAGACFTMRLPLVLAKERRR